MKGMNFSNYSLSRNSGSIMVHLNIDNSICGHIYFFQAMQHPNRFYENTYKCSGCDLYCWHRDLGRVPTTNLLYTNSIDSIEFDRTAMLNHGDKFKTRGSLNLNVVYNHKPYVIDEKPVPKPYPIDNNIQDKPEQV